MINDNEKDSQDEGNKKALVKKFINADSTEELEKTVKDIADADEAIDTEKMDKAGEKFHKEKRAENHKEAKNDADFEQPDVSPKK